jgi:hypothetical protein
MQVSEVKIEAIYGFENVISKLLSNQLDDAFKAASMLALELGLPNPLSAYEKYEVVKDLYTHRIPYLIRADALRSLGVRPIITYEDGVKLFFQLKYQMLKELFVFLRRAKAVMEEAFGVPINTLMNPQVIDTIIYRSTGTILGSGSEQPNYQNAIISCIYSLLTGVELKRSIKLLKLALLHENYLWLAKHGPIIKRNVYVAMFLKYEFLFTRLHNAVRAKLEPHVRALTEGEGMKHLEYSLPREWLRDVDKRLPAPFLIVERRAWATGIPITNGTVNLDHPRFPWRSQANRPLLVTILAVTGSGKTTLLNSFALYMLERGSFGLRLEVDVDDRMQGQLMALPLHQNHPAIEELKFLQMQPRGLVVKRPNVVYDEIRRELRDPNVISLMVVKSKKDLDTLTTKPTKIDRIVYVKELSAFHLPWDRIYKPGRLITLRFHSERKTATVFTALLKSYALWRMSRKENPVFIQIDEAYLGAASRISMRYGKTYARSAEQTEVFMRGARGLAISTYLSTQRPFFVAAGTRSQVSHIFSSYLGEKRDIEAVLERLPPKAIDINVVDTFLNRSEIRSSPYFWFLWVNLLDSMVKVVRPVMPPTGAEMPDMTAWDQFDEYGLTYESWDQVPTLFKDVGTEENPLEVYEPFLPEKELEKLYAKMKGLPAEAVRSEMKEHPKRRIEESEKEESIKGIEDLF